MRIIRTIPCNAHPCSSFFLSQAVCEVCLVRNLAALARHAEQPTTDCSGPPPKQATHPTSSHVAHRDVRCVSKVARVKTRACRQPGFMATLASNFRGRNGAGGHLYTAHLRGVLRGKGGWPTALNARDRGWRRSTPPAGRDRSIEAVRHNPSLHQLRH